jgi:hypothetical protein
MTRSVLVPILLAALVAACSPVPAAPPAAATVPPEVTEAPTATAAPPTATTVRRPTLPPVWTATAIPTVTPTATPAPPTDIPEGANPVVADCLRFNPDIMRNPGWVEVGESPTVYWTGSGGPVFYYEVVVRNRNGISLDVQRTRPSARSAELPAGIFEHNEVYTWSVAPYNSAGQAICPPRTSELRASLD